MKEKILKVSVGNLVDFVLKKGDLKTVFMSRSRMAQGIKGHQFVQKRRPENYDSEVSISHIFKKGDISVHISGRIDGIFNQDPYIIDEIKTTKKDLDLIDENYNLLHWAQAKLYAYFFSLNNDLKKIIVQLTYFHLKTKKIKEIPIEYDFHELKDFFNNVILKYVIWAEKILEWQTIRDESIKNCDFPFPKYRNGQRFFAVKTYKTIENKKNLFAQAPTGIGKTMATIFPAIKAINENLISKIFYLTAKTIGRSVANDTLDILRKNKLKLKSITLTAKDKICFEPEASCNPDECSYAKDYYTNRFEAIEDIFKEDSFKREKIIEYAEKHQICPFEFSLDISLWADVIICDYNYAFDPNVYLRRFFEVSLDKYSFLIDEAHNLPDRARSMFSSEIEKQNILNIRREIKEELPHLAKILNQINKFLLEKRKSCDKKKFLVEDKKPKELLKLMSSFNFAAEKFFEKNIVTKFSKDLLDLYFEFNNFLKTADNFSEIYASYFEKKGKYLKAKLFCKNPAPLLKEALKRAESNIFFSATLIPLEYYQLLITDTKDDEVINIESPFPRENFSLLINKKISTYYKDREKSYKPISDLIRDFCEKKTANYLIYFPSYTYMNKVLDIFGENNSDKFKIHIQERQMNETNREKFIEEFKENPKETNIGFAVMGGIFGEGIDLVGSRLFATIIVGVGLPMINLERNLIKEFFDEKGFNGYQFSYQYPGFNRVLQSAGRVIRSEKDVGTVILVDVRFGFYNYRRIFPQHWKRFDFIT